MDGSSNIRSNLSPSYYRQEVIVNNNCGKTSSIASETLTNFSHLKPFLNPPKSFSEVHSGILVTSQEQYLHRKDFLSSEEWKTCPPVISKSEFISREMAEHLMRHKKDSALGVKYKPGDEITNMEGAMHTFVTPICLCHMVGDYAAKMGHIATEFENHQLRQVIISAAVHPDLEGLDLWEGEYDLDVMMSVLSLKDEAFSGEALDLNTQVPSKEEKLDPKFRAQYEEKLLRHMVYHLTKEHALPAKKDVKTMNKYETIAFLEEQIAKPTMDREALQNNYVEVYGHILSLEAYFNTYVLQLRNEFSAFEALFPQGYIYTIDPPKIFSRAIGGPDIPNRLQILAFKYLLQNNSFSHLKGIAHSDDNCVDLLKTAAHQNIEIISKDEIFSGEDYTYFPSDASYALIRHNNSDGFGQNIETEGLTSLDGWIGSYSDAACVLKRDRPDLLDLIF